MKDWINLLIIGTAVAAFLAGFVATFVATPIIARRNRARKIIGIDVHKLNKPLVPEMCGISIQLGLVSASIIFAVLYSSGAAEATAFALTIVIAGIIGIIDDLRPLGPIVKPVLTAIAASPILAMGTYYSHPVLPFIGRVRLTIVYPLLIVLAIAVTANSVNMLDVLNGSMTGSISVLAFAMSIMIILKGRPEISVLSAGLVGTMVAFHIYNRYPAKVFAGDAGSIPVGAAVGALAILGEVEALTVIATIPHILNAFYGLTSVGRLYERHEIQARPTSLRTNGALRASLDSKAPITLVRVVLAGGPLREQEIVRILVYLSILSSLLALLTVPLLP